MIIFSLSNTKSNSSVNIWRTISLLMAWATGFFSTLEYNNSSVTAKGFGLRFLPKHWFFYCFIIRNYCCPKRCQVEEKPCTISRLKFVNGFPEPICYVILSPNIAPWNAWGMRAVWRSDHSYLILTNSFFCSLIPFWGGIIPGLSVLSEPVKFPQGHTGCLFFSSQYCFTSTFSQELLITRNKKPEKKFFVRNLKLSFCT